MGIQKLNHGYITNSGLSWIKSARTFLFALFQRSEEQNDKNTHAPSQANTARATNSNRLDTRVTACLSKREQRTLNYYHLPKGGTKGGPTGPKGRERGRKERKGPRVKVKVGDKEKETKNARMSTAQNKASSKRPFVGWTF